ncbi:MAG TPA: hypothetical protein VFY91_04445 [Microbacterium sp.]|nr:hypothetical protein [Microbacterium sp.]
MKLRRLAATLAAAVLALGGALVAVPPASAAATAGPAVLIDAALVAEPAFTIVPSGPERLQPGEAFDFFLEVTRDEDLSLDDGSQIALTISYPETLAFRGGDCDAYYFASTEQLGSSPNGFASGDQCVVDGDIAADPSAYVSLSFVAVEELTPTVPPPTTAQIGFAIDRVVLLNDEEDEFTDTRTIEPRVEAADSVDLDLPPYLPGVWVFGMTWPDEDVIEVEYTLRAPDLGENAAAPYSYASTTWDLRGPDFAGLILDEPDTDDPNTDNELCEPESLTLGYCEVTFTQRAGDISAVPFLPDAPTALVLPLDHVEPLPEGCEQGYCEYSITLHFRSPSDFAGHAVAGDFSMRSAGTSYAMPDADPGPMPPEWTQDAVASHTVVAEVVETSVELSAAARPIGGEDVIATISVTQFPDVDVVAAYGDDVLLEVELKITWPYFLDLDDPPTGCQQWRSSDSVCVLRFWDSPPGAAKEVSATFFVPGERPPYGLTGEVAVAASYVRVVGTNDGFYTIEEVPTSVVIGDSAPFELYSPALLTDVRLSSVEGWPGGDDLVATFELEHLSTSSVSLESGTAVVRLSWPAFLTLAAGPSPTACQGFVLEAGGTSGTCTVPGIGPPGWSTSFDMTFSMPPEGDERSETGDIGIAGVSLTGTSNGVETVYGDEYIVPSAQRFTIDDDVFPVDIALDRTASTPGGLRLYAEIRVTYDHALQDDVDVDAVGLEFGWPSFLSVTTPPDISGCDEWEDDVCYLTGLESVGDFQIVRIWFDMPADSVGVGTITATGVRLCNGPPTDCTELPAAWIGSDAEEFTVLEPRITVDLTIDRDTGWTGGQPVTATATITHEGAIPGELPGMTVDLILDWPGFLTPLSIGGCDSVLAGGVCRVNDLGVVTSSKQLTLRFSMPGVEPFRASPTAYPKAGDIRVSGVALSYLAPPPTPLPPADPCAAPTPDPTGVPTPSPSSSATPTSTPSPTPACSPTPTPTGTPSQSPTPTVTPDPTPTLAAIPVPAEPPDLVEVPLPPEWIGADSVGVRVIQPKVTIVPGVARPGGVVTVYLEDFPPLAALTMGWTAGSGSPAALTLKPDVAITQHRMLIFRRELLGERGLVVTSTDGSFGNLQPGARLRVVPRSTVADELVGRGG